MAVFPEPFGPITIVVDGSNVTVCAVGPKHWKLVMRSVESFIDLFRFPRSAASAAAFSGLWQGGLEADDAEVGFIRLSHIHHRFIR